MISDAELSQDGLPPAGQGQILLIACGALAREILALKAANNWSHLDLHCLPAILHNHPDRIIPRTELLAELDHARSIARGAVPA